MVVVQPVDTSEYPAPVALSDDVLGEMLDAHRQSAFNLAYRLVRRPEDAADAVQDAFVLAVRATRGDTAAPRDADHFRPWLLKIVANVALGQLRRKRSDATSSLDDLTLEPADPRVEQPLTALMQRERRGDVLNALLVLPDDQRIALTLREYQELSYDEIGELLGMDRAAITALLYRARCAFRRVYQGLMSRSTPIGCPELAPLISAMLDEELDRESWRGVEQHVSGCRRCWFELRQLRSARRLHATIPLLAPPTGWSWAATLEAARVAGGAGAAGLVSQATGLGAVVATGTAAGASNILPAASLGGLLLPIGELLTGRMTGLAVIVGLNLGVMLGAPAHQTGDRGMVQAAVAPVVVAVAPAATTGDAATPDGTVQLAVAAGQAEPPADTRAVAASTDPALAAGQAVASAPAVAVVPAEVIGPLPPAPLVQEDAQVANAATSVSPDAATTAQAQAPSSSVESEHSTSPSGPTSAAPNGPASTSPASPDGPGAANGPGPAGAGPVASTVGQVTGTVEQVTGTVGSIVEGVLSPPQGGPPPPDLPPLDVPPIDPPAIDLPPVDLPAVDLPPIDLPAVNLPAIDPPPIDLPAIDVPPISLPVAGVPPIDLPAIDVPEIDVEAIDLPEIDPAAIDLPAVDLAPIDVEAIDVEAIDLPPVALPLVDGVLDSIRGGTAEAARGHTPSQQTFSNGGTTGLGPGQAGSQTVEVSVSGGNPDDKGGGSLVDFSVRSGTAPDGPANGGQTLVDASVNVDGPAGGSTLSVGTDPAPGAGSATLGASVEGGAGNEGSSSLSVSVGADGGSVGSGGNNESGSNGSTSLSVSIDSNSGGGNSGNSDNGSSNSTSLSVSVDTSSSNDGGGNSGNSDNGSTSLSVSVDTSSNGGGDSGGGGNNDSGSLSVSVSVDVGSSDSGGGGNDSGNSGNGGGGVSVSVGGISVSVP